MWLLIRHWQVQAILCPPDGFVIHSFYEWADNGGIKMHERTASIRWTRAFYIRFALREYPPFHVAGIVIGIMYSE